LSEIDRVANYRELDEFVGPDEAVEGLPAVNPDTGFAGNLPVTLESEKLSLRAAADQIGCGAATLARLLQGSKAPNFPDTDTLIRASSWLGKSISNFEQGKRPQASSVADVEVHLRALPGISSVDAEALVAMVKAAYDAASQRRKKEELGVGEAYFLRIPSNGTSSTTVSICGSASGSRWIRAYRRIRHSISCRTRQFSGTATSRLQMHTSNTSAKPDRAIGQVWRLT
jgi:transcriptional regulator with XRE-family HTH domain